MAMSAPLTRCRSTVMPYRSFRRLKASKSGMKAGSSAPLNSILRAVADGLLAVATVGAMVGAGFATAAVGATVGAAVGAEVGAGAGAAVGTAGEVGAEQALASQTPPVPSRIICSRSRRFILAGPLSATQGSAGVIAPDSNLLYSACN